MVDSPAERLAVALRQARDKVMTQIDLAGALGESQSWVSRRESGEVEASPSELARIEEALGLPAGTVYKLAGLVGDGGSARAAIAADPLLNQRGRNVVLATYDAVLVELREQAQSTPGASHHHA